MNNKNNCANEKNIKQDLNFLDNPLWIQDEKISQKYRDKEDNLFKWQVTHNGKTYQLRTFHTPPTRLDIVVKYFLLGYSQYNGWTRRLNNLSIYQIIQGCDWHDNSYYYGRILEALKRWANIIIQFDDSFYDKHNKAHMSKVFHILNYEHQDGKLDITLDDKWLDLIKDSLHYQIFDFQAYKKMSNAKDPLAMRLYEILSKKFLTSHVWPIDLQVLALKCGTENYYPSRFRPKIKRAIENLNSLADMSLDFEMKRHSKGTTVYFKNKESSKVIPRPGEDSLWDDILSLIPESRMDNKKNLAKLYHLYDKRGSDQIKNSIKYVNRMRVSRYWAYLFDTIKNEYWRDMFSETSTKEAQKEDQSNVHTPYGNKEDKFSSNDSFRTMFRKSEHGAELLKLAKWKDQDILDIIIENYFSKGKDFCEGVLRLAYNEKAYNSKSEYIENLNRLFTEKDIDQLPIRTKSRSGNSRGKRPRTKTKNKKGQDINQERIDSYINSLTSEETDNLVDEALQYIKSHFGPLVYDLCAKNRHDPFSESNLNSAMQEVVRYRLASE